MKNWNQNKETYQNYLRKRMALSFGDYEVESDVRDQLIEAIKACDETKIGEIRVKNFDNAQTVDVLKRVGAYPYAVSQIRARRNMIETVLGNIFPDAKAEPIRDEIFKTLKVEKNALTSNVVSVEAKAKIRESGLADYMGLKV